MVVAVDCPNMEVDEEAARAEGWPKMEPEAEEAGCPKTEVLLRCKLILNP